MPHALDAGEQRGHLCDEGGGNGDVIFQGGNLRSVFGHCHGQQALILVIRHNYGLCPSLLSIVCLQAPPQNHVQVWAEHTGQALSAMG